MSSPFGNPAGSLLGITLDNGWVVKEFVKKKPEDTGGHFSVCYIVEREKQRAFLKALDLSFAFEQSDFISAINDLTTAFIFERDLLYKCKSNHLSKIVSPIEHGQYSQPGQPPYLSVYYIIFEVADTNLRKQISAMKSFDFAWILRSLHNTAVGLQQLHQSGIAHQDLKPSNVLVFQNESKISDLGRSSDSKIPSRNDRFRIAGDKTYAPFELFYETSHFHDFNYRYASDLYHLGSLIFFYFLRVNLQQIIMLELKKSNLVNNLTGKDFKADLPYFQLGYNQALIALENELMKYSSDLTLELIALAKKLTNPDPKLRGFSEIFSSSGNQYSLERFISRFDLLAKRAEHNLL